MFAQIHSLSAVAGGCRESIPRPAAPALRGHVLGYCGFEATPKGALLHRILPFNVTTLIIDWTGASPLITGPRDTGLLYGESGWRSGVTIGLTPAGVRRLLGVPQPELAGRILSLDDLIGPRAVRLAERLAATPDWESRFAALDRWAATRLAATGEADPEPLIDTAWWRLQTGRAPATIGALATRLGVSQRYLQLGFRRQIGLPPKTVARIGRFQRAVTTLHRVEGGYAAPGYADQPHFCRETRAMTGVTPRELFAFVQDAWPASA